MVEQGKRTWMRGWAYLTRQSRTARIGLGVSALVLVSCGCCGGFIASAIGSTPSTAATQAGGVATATARGHAAVTITSELATATARAPTPTPKALAWVTTQHFSGHDNQQTPTWSAAGTWRIVWTCRTTDPSGGAFSIELTQAIDGTPIDLIANTTTSGGATYNSHTGDGQFYLKIDALFMDYDITVQEYR